MGNYSNKQKVFLTSYAKDVFVTLNDTPFNENVSFLILSTLF